MLTENEDWITERGGDIVEKKARFGLAKLTDLEHLVYCLWIADYMMRNSGDFANAEDLYPEFQSEAAIRAKRLGLSETYAAFTQSRADLECEYLNRFETICNEIRNAEGAG